ncbi:hypothetical protein FQZ97_810810 [compost metagenome]
MFQVAGGLGGAHGEAAAITRRFRAHGVVRPVQGEGGGAAVARGEPATQRQQQAARAEQQGRGVVHAEHQFQPLREALGQRDPAVHLGCAAVGPVERGEQLFVKAPADAATRQPPHIAQRSAADVREREAVRSHGAERVHGQGVEQHVQRLAKTVLHASARQRQRGQAVGRPGDLAHAQLGALRDHTLPQRVPAAKQAHARRQLHDHGFVSDSNPGRELEGPDRQRLQRRVSGRGGVVGCRQPER